MQKRLIFLIGWGALASTSCSTLSNIAELPKHMPGVYKIDVQQGNVISQEKVDQLQPGMTRRQVRFIMGTPLMVDAFHQNRWTYMYTMQPGGEEREQEYLSLFFEDNKLARLAGDFLPEPSPGPMPEGKDIVVSVPDGVYNRDRGIVTRTLRWMGIGDEE